MAYSTLESTIQSLLAPADIQLQGNRPWDIHIYNNALYSRVLAEGSIGLGESYMDGWWDCHALDQCFARILSHRITERLPLTRQLMWHIIKAKFYNLQKGRRSWNVGTHHYDLGNDLYTAMLDKRLVYTCAYWQDAHTLDSAQEAKLELVCKKLHLQPGMSVLDIGCGWGSFARYAAEKYQVRVVGITISQEQVTLARELCRHVPVEIRLQDYRDVREPFDRIVSLGMFEHVGYKNYRTYFEVAHRCLKEQGLFLLHTIGTNISTTCGDPWLEKYIFPNSMLPSIKQIGAAIERLFVMEDWHNFSAFYDRTLIAWFTNFTAAWPLLQTRYNERFYRMWTYYLLSCAGAFRARHCQLWQIVISKGGVPGGYTSIR